MAKEHRILLTRIFIDIFCFGLVFLANTMLRDHAHPVQRGFFCNDESLSYPYHDSTVSISLVYAISLSPVLIIILTEFLNPAKKLEPSKKIIAGYNFPPCLWQCYKVIGVFLFGANCVRFMTNITKYASGRLRPHFMDICRPNVNCSLLENQHRYIEQFECLGNNTKRLLEMRLSFLSGHSSFPAYCMVFLGIYIYARWTWQGSRLLPHMVQLLAFTFTLCTAMTRIFDNKHHWSDVFAGLLFGTIVALLAVWFAEIIPSRIQSRASVSHQSSLPMVQRDISGLDSCES